MGIFRSSACGEAAGSVPEIMSSEYNLIDFSLAVRKKYFLFSLIKYVHWASIQHRTHFYRFAGNCSA